MRRAVLLLALAAAPALADPTADEAAERYDRGVKFSQAGDNLSALAEFQQAYKLTGRWEVLFNIGVVEKRLFRYGDAIHTFARYLQDGGAKIPADRRAEVERAQAEIHALVAEISVVVDGAPATIEVDKLAVGTSPLTEPLLVAPGHHELAARRTGEADVRAIDVVSGQHADVRLAPASTDAVPRTARLAIVTTPTGGTLVVDSQPVGAAPWSAVVQAGVHDVVATLAGRLTVKQDIVIVGGQDRSVTLVLADVPPPPTPVYKRWYVLVGAGVVLLGGSIAIYEATRTRPDAVISFP